MNIQRPGSLSQRALLAFVLLGMTVPLPGAPPAPVKASEPAAPALVEAFQKGPISMTATVTHVEGSGGPSVLPLFQVPVLAFDDKLELSFSGEAFDQRVTPADWSLIVVFLPKTVAPTDQGVVDFRLRRKDGRMVVPPIPVPYDSIPMIFLVPDRNGRKKVLKDLNDHLESFRTLCAKIADIATERAAADKFIQDLDAIDKNLSAVQYDSALGSFLHAYGDPVSTDLQGFLGTSRSNLDKCQFLTQEFRNTNVLVPASTAAAPVSAQVTVAGGTVRPVSTYVSIIFDLAAIINNLWPGHQFQYLPAVARDFHDSSADLYYSDWIHTTGEVRGALMCCPGKWEEQTPPAFDLALPPGESLLKKQALLSASPKAADRSPFSLFGHDWKLLVTGPKGEGLPPLPLTVSPTRKAFVASPGPILDALRKLGAPRVKARIVGRWGFTSIAMDPVELPAGCDPAWTPSAQETADFQIGKGCAFKLPAAWAAAVERVGFRPSAPGSAPLAARLEDLKDGSRSAVFHPKAGDAGPGSLEIQAFGAAQPALSRPLTLVDAPPEAAGLEARLGETSVRLRGRNLQGVQALELGGRRFRPDPGTARDETARVFLAEDGKPLDGAAGTRVAAALVLARGGRTVLGPVALMAARPRIADVQLIPVEAKSTGLALSATIPIASTNDPSQVSLLTPRGYRFPADGAFRAAIRNAEEPSEIRVIAASRIRVMGHNQKATFTFTPSDLMGGRASGRLEVQVQDDHAGASDWCALPATFLDLPAIGAVQGTAAGFRLIGRSLDQIEAVAPAREGPWEKAGITIEDGREVAGFTTRPAGNTCYLRLFGWDDLALAVTFPPLPQVAAPPAPRVEVAALKAKTVASTVGAPAAKAEVPANREGVGATKAEALAPKVEVPAAKSDAPAPKADATATKVDAPATKVVPPAPGNISQATGQIALPVPPPANPVP